MLPKSNKKILSPRTKHPHYMTTSDNRKVVEWDMSRMICCLKIRTLVLTNELIYETERESHM